MHVVITGGAGFIGSHVVDRFLSAGHRVTVLDNLSAGRPSNLEPAKKLAQESGDALHFLQGDVRFWEDWDRVPPADALLHFAAQTSVTASLADPQIDFDSNALATLNVCRWIQKNRPKYYLYANTAGALYGATDSLPTAESHPIWPDSLYGATKAFGEIYIHAFVRSLKASGFFSSNPQDSNYFSWAALRLANVYGERQVSKGEAGVLPIFVEKFVRGEAPLVFGENAVTRDYVHVLDVAEAFFRTFETLQGKSLDSGFNVGTGVETRSEDVYRFVFEAMRGTRFFPEIQKFQIPKRAPLRPGEVLRSCVDSRKLQAATGWMPKKKFEAATQEFVSYFLEKEV